MQRLLLLVLLLCATQARAMPPLPAWLSEPLPVGETSDEAVAKLVQRGADHLHSDQVVARTALVAAMKRVRSGDSISEYDYLWAYQGLMATCYDASNALTQCSRDDYLGIGRRAFAVLRGRSWVAVGRFMPEGQALYASCRTIGNNLAWVLHDGPAEASTDLDESLQVIERAESCIGTPDDYFVYDTKARILLKMDRTDDAFGLIAKVLDEVPEFEWFQEFLHDDAYLAWREAR